MESKVIIDTNVLISFLIGKRLAGLKDRIVDLSIILIYSEQLIREIRMVTSRPKFERYFIKEDVEEFINLLSIIGLSFEVDNIPDICRDPKDNFLLGLITVSQADYLVTGDRDLLDLKKFNSASILSPVEFEKLISA